MKDHQTTSNVEAYAVICDVHVGAVPFPPDPGEMQVSFFQRCSQGSAVQQLNSGVSLPLFPSPPQGPLRSLWQTDRRRKFLCRCRRYHAVFL